MAIRIFLGKPGSGKTALAVREMARMHNIYQYYTNIKTDIPNCHLIDGSMIVKKEETGVKNKRDGSKEIVYKKTLNVDFWKSVVGQTDKPVSVILDEAHSIINARRSMSNVIATDWLALIRRVLGSTPQIQGDLILISQLWFRLDSIAREMANEILWCTDFFTKFCVDCGYSQFEHSDMSKFLKQCPECRSYKLDRRNHRILVRHFRDGQHFEDWEQYDTEPEEEYFVNDIEKSFPKYNTLQWDNLFSDV